MDPPTGEPLPRRRFAVNRWANMRLAFFCILAVGSAWSPVLDSPAHKWGASVFFGTGIVLSLVSLLPRSTYLELGPEGFLARSYFIPWRVRWTDVESFQVGYRSAPRSIGLVYKDGAPIRSPRWARRAVRGVTGVEAALAFDYGVDPHDLAGMMEGYRERAERGVETETAG